MVAEAESPDIIVLAESAIIVLAESVMVVVVSVVSVFLDEHAVASANTVRATKPVLMIAFIVLGAFLFRLKIYFSPLNTLRLKR